MKTKMTEKTKNNNSYKEIAEKIKASETMLIFPHVNLDGDALGSASALCLALRKIGKKAFVLISEEVPHNLDFLEQGLTLQKDEVDQEIDLGIMVDCGSIKRIFSREEEFKKTKYKICIDHHATKDDDVKFDMARVESDSSATGEMIYYLIKELGCDIDEPIANSLFAAITTDTGNFQHTNTTARTHEIMSELHNTKGFNCKAISSLIYDRNSLEFIRMMCDVLGKVRLYLDGRIALASVSQADLKEFKCKMNETDGIIQRVMSIDGVQIGMLLKETEFGNTKISLRSKSEYDVSDLAVKFDGGGHKKAAGCSMKKNIEETEKAIIEAAKELME